jgi:serine/threonine protein phosphatase PrpC
MRTIVISHRKRSPNAADAAAHAEVAASKIARRVDFTQVHLISQATGMRQVVHVGSTVGTSHAEWVMNPTARQPVRLQFVRGEGTPLVASLLAAPRDTSLMVDNVPARPTVPIHNGSLLNVDGISYTIELVAGGSLPAVTRVDAAWATNIGPRRDINQDAIGIYQHPDAYLFAVADGVGGGYAGEEVSAYAVKYLQSVFKRNIPYDNLSWYEIFGTAYDYINREVRNWVQHTPQPAGTTLTALTIRSWTATVAHVGDSRLYLLRHGNLRQITTDHNDNVPVETRNRAGYPVTIERSVLQKAIGKTNTISPDVTTFSLQPGDRLLLTTDGVTNQITDDELREVLATSSLSSIPDDLVELSNTRDNKDNASVIALEVLAESYERDTWVADPDDRVYVGGPAWYLELRPPQEMNTVYSAITGTGCLLLLIALVAFGAVWGGRTVRNALDPEPNVMVNPISGATLGPSPTLQITVTSQTNATATQTIVTETAIPSPTIVPTITLVPTQPVQAIPTQSDTFSTPILPTSTVRPGR